MKKIMTAMLMVLALVGCGGGDPEPEPRCSDRLVTCEPIS